MISTPKPRYDFIDVLRVLAVVMVLGSHTVAASFLLHEPSSPTVWMTTAFLYMMFRPCVALYVLISGALLLNSESTASGFEFLRKRLPRLFLPVIVWSVIYAAWNTLIGRTPALSWSLPLKILHEPLSQHLWFMYMYLGITVSVPIFKSFYKSASISDLRYAIACLLAASAGQVILNSGFHISISSYFFAPFGYWAYLLLGAFLLKSNIPPISTKGKTALFVALYLISVWGTTYVIRHDPAATTNLFNNVLGPFQFMESALLFKLIQSLNFEKIYAAAPGFKTAIQNLTKFSFGIYLCHILIMEFLAWGVFGFQLRWLTLHPFFGIPATWGLMLLFSWGLCWFLSRIRGLRWILAQQ